MNEQQYQTPVEEQEIDLVELIAKLWHNRGLIIKTTVLFMVVGLMVALFSAKVFSAGCEIVPQTGNSSSSSSLSSLAALAGIRVNNTGNNSTLSPYVYENIVSSVPFRKDLMYTKIHFAEFEEPITLFDYYFNSNTFYFRTCHSIPPFYFWTTKKDLFLSLFLLMLD